jgi:hypothetical protein
LAVCRVRACPNWPAAPVINNFMTGNQYLP